MAKSVGRDLPHPAALSIFVDDPLYRPGVDSLALSTDEKRRCPFLTTTGCFFQIITDSLTGRQTDRYESLLLPPFPSPA